MKRWIIFAAMLLLPACTQTAAEVPPTPTEIPVATAVPSPSPTVLPDPSPTNTPPPSATDVPAVIAQATEPQQIPSVEIKAVTPTETPPPTNTPLPTDTPVPTDTPSPTPEPDWATNYGRTTENLMYLGNPNAPVTIIDFSDFM